MNGLKKLLESYKGVAFLLVIIALTVLVALGKATMEHFVWFVTIGYPALAVARAAEEGMKARTAGVALLGTELVTSGEED